MDETLELAERKCPFNYTLGSHGLSGQRVRHRRAVGADARSLLGGNSALVLALWPERSAIAAKSAVLSSF
jgi:hypothetical protein